MYKRPASIKHWKFHTVRQRKERNQKDQKETEVLFFAHAVRSTRKIQQNLQKKSSHVFPYTSHVYMDAEIKYNCL